MSEQVLIDRPDCKVIQYKTSCLSHFAYLINCDGEIAIVDPLRDIYSYMMAIDEAGASLKYILETHYHADFVSGFLDLAKKTGAEVVFGPNSNPSFKARVLEDGASIKLGNYTIRCIHTPGHTMESSCFTLEKGNEVLSVFTGDTLFLGDVGRPDLAQKGDLTDKVLAKHLFSSLKKLKKYPDNVLVLPSHGAGSACGKSISTGNKSTIGEQKSTNCAFKEADEAAFIERVTTGLPTPPKYFGDNVRMNKSADTKSVDDITTSMEPIAAEKLKEMIAKNPNLIVLDVRPAKDFIQGHIPRSLHVPLDGKLAIWATYVIDNNESFVVVCNPGDEADVATRLSRTGLDKAQGFLEGGFEAWKSAGYPTDKVRTLQAETGDEFAQKTSNGVVLDIRDPGELEGGIYEKAITKNFAQLKDSLKDKNDKEVFIHCAGGVRSLIGYSLMKRQGYNVTNIDGGFNRLAKIGVKTKKWAGKPACCLI